MLTSTLSSSAVGGSALPDNAKLVHRLLIVWKDAYWTVMSVSAVHLGPDLRKVLGKILSLAQVFPKFILSLS